MSLVRRMAGVAAECVRTPEEGSVWSERLQKYVCKQSPEYRRALDDLRNAAAVGHPPINSTFKLVFLASLAGTVLFVVICVVTTLLAGRDPPPLLEKVVMGLFDLAKIGFGAIVGLLGAQSLKGRS